MEHIPLSENHRRSISASILMIEKLILEIETVLVHPAVGVLYNVMEDIETRGEYDETIKLVGEIKAYVSLLKEKYQLTPDITRLRWFIEVRKTKIWEILGNIRSGKMKRYGTFPAEYVAEFDKDMGKLQAMTEKL
jgi:hypothetical protein